MGDDSSYFLEVPGSFEGYDMDKLKLDQAYLSVMSEVKETLYLYAVSDDCVKCPFVPVEATNVNSNGTLYTLSTTRPWQLLFADNMTDYLQPEEEDPARIHCRLANVVFGEFGVYGITLRKDDCTLETLKDPVFVYGGLIIAVAVYLVLLAIVSATPFVLRRLSRTGLASCCRGDNTETGSTVWLSTSEAPADPAKKKPPTKPRVKSLDTFRGLSIVLMILVNYGAGGYWFMQHATWDGLQVSDLVFPWFLWIMGVCIPMGLRSALRRRTPKPQIFWRIIKRSLKLFMLGIILNSLGGWVTLSRYRVPGVLQRFGACYLVVAGVMLWLPEVKERQGKLGALFNDLIVLGWQWIFYLALVALHVVLMFCVPVPGCPTGYIGPGGVDLVTLEGEYKPECIGGLTGYADRWLLGVNHIYQNPTAKDVYQSGPFDPEGVFSTMLSVFQVFLGLVAGNVLDFHKTPNGRMVRWLMWGVVCGGIGTVLCFAGQQGAPMPVNKNLWSLSYVMVTSCFAFFLLAFFYLLVDKLQVWGGAPLYQAGMNSIFLYVGHQITFEMFPWHYIIGPMRTHAALLAECLWGTTLWVLTGLYLHSINKFYTV